jgi:hypothetical protein
MRDLNHYKLSLNQPLLDNMGYWSKEFRKWKEKQEQATTAIVPKICYWLPRRCRASHRGVVNRSPTGESRKAAATAKDSSSRHRQLRCSDLWLSTFGSSPPPSPSGSLRGSVPDVSDSVDYFACVHWCHMPGPKFGLARGPSRCLVG